MIDAMKPMELLPKDILQFVERNAERAIEILREMIDMPEYDNVQLTQAIDMPNQFIGGNILGGTGNGITWTNLAATTTAQQVAQGGLNV